jgi:hypothetical protein
MKASTVIYQRRRIGRWLMHSLPPEPEDQDQHIYQPDPDPPGEKKGAADPSAAVETDHAPAGTRG